MNCSLRIGFFVWLMPAKSQHLGCQHLWKRTRKDSELLIRLPPNRKTGSPNGVKHIGKSGLILDKENPLVRAAGALCSELHGLYHLPGLQRHQAMCLAGGHILTHCPSPPRAQPHRHARTPGLFSQHHRLPE